MIGNIRNFIYPATEYKVVYEKRSLFGTGLFNVWEEASVERVSNDIHIATNITEGKVFVNGVEYLPAQSKTIWSQHS